MPAWFPLAKGQILYFNTSPVSLQNHAEDGASPYTFLRPNRQSS